MDTKDYTKNVVARASNEFHNDFPMIILGPIMLEFCMKARALDLAKKSMFYGKFSGGAKDQQVVDVGFELAGKYEGEGAYFGLTANSGEPILLNDKQVQLFHSILGLATEAGELMEAFVNGLSAVQGEEVSIDDAFDVVNMNEELGDALWYIALGCDSVGYALDECMTINDKKLEARYGPAFSAERANERDLDKERAILEDK